MGMLDGKAIVITGSGGGIGGGCAKGCVRQGASVVINDLDAQEVDAMVEAIRADGGTATGCVADVTGWEDAKRLIETCISAFGKIDGLVNNAAICRAQKIDAFGKEDADFVRTMLDVNVMGPLNCTAHAVRAMVAQGSGSIVNVVSGAHMGIASLSAYGASKGALASYTYTWALELEQCGIRVNGLSPFGAGTKMQLPDPLSQQPEANAPVVEYLLSERAAHVTGQLVRIDREEIYLYAHPALLVPPAVRPGWTAELLADAFDGELKERLVPCGIKGIESLPVDIKGGYWQRRVAVEAT